MSTTHPSLAPSSALHVISGGAAKGLVAGLQTAFSEQHGAPISGQFGAVGLMKTAFLAGAPCDVLILTAAQMSELQASGDVLAGSLRPLGRVRTGVAVPAGAPKPDVGSAQGLGLALEQASAVYFPDPEQATAGIHFMKVLRALGLHESLGPRLSPWPNGATAMQAMADAAQRGAAGLLGCTQITEILYTPGIELVGPLPAEFELATVYTAGVAARSPQAALAQAWVNALASEQAALQRAQGGFEPI